MLEFFLMGEALTQGRQFGFLLGMAKFFLSETFGPENCLEEYKAREYFLAFIFCLRENFRFKDFLVLLTPEFFALEFCLTQFFFQNFSLYTPFQI